MWYSYLLKSRFVLNSCILLLYKSSDWWLMLLKVMIVIVITHNLVEILTSLFLLSVLVQLHDHRVEFLVQFFSILSQLLVSFDFWVLSWFTFLVKHTSLSTDLSCFNMCSQVSDRVHLLSEVWLSVHFFYNLYPLKQSNDCLVVVRHFVNIETWTLGNSLNRVHIFFRDSRWINEGKFGKQLWISKHMSCVCL